MAKAPLEKELLQHRRLLGLFVRRELQARYAGSFLGIFWSVIHPLILLALYIVVFSTLVPRSGRLPFRSATAEYAVFLCPALIAWNWFLESLMGAVNSIVGNAPLIRKTVFPISILPAIPVLASAMGFAVAMLAFLVFLVAAGHGHWAILVWLPVLVVLEFLLVLGPAYLVATMNVFLRDTSQVLFAIMQVLFWATPVVYPAEVVTKHAPLFQWWFRLNPFARLVDCFRQVIILGQAPDLESFLYLCIVIIFTYYLGRAAFQRARARFVDEV
jgi:ABC-type polysaccharide/polyol phosphate export permease